jgi:hypothetical protein
VFLSEHDIPLLCEMNMLGTSDPEDHTLTAHTFLPSITEMQMTTNRQCNSPENLNRHQQCYKNLKSHTKQNPVSQLQLMLPLSR